METNVGVQLREQPPGAQPMPGLGTLPVDWLDAGLIGWIAKSLPGGEHEICLSFEPGILAGTMMEFPEQTLGTVTIDRAGSWEKGKGRTFGTLDAVTFSELVRDLEALR